VRSYGPLYCVPLSVETRHFTEETAQRRADFFVPGFDDVRVVPDAQHPMLPMSHDVAAYDITRYSMLVEAIFQGM
jgi:hypothetical protein